MRHIAIFLAAGLFCTAAIAATDFEVKSYPPNPEASKALARAQLDLEQRRDKYQVALDLMKYESTSPDVARFLIDNHLLISQEPSFVRFRVQNAYQTVISSGQLQYLPAFYHEWVAKRVDEKATEFLVPALNYVATTQNNNDGEWALRQLSDYWFHHCDKTIFSTKCWVSLPTAGKYFKQAINHPYTDFALDKTVADTFAEQLFKAERYPEAAGWYMVELDLLKMSQMPDQKDMAARAAYMQKLYAQHGAAVPLQNVIDEVQQDELLRRVKDSDRIWHRLDLIRQNGFQAVDPFAGG